MISTEHAGVDDISLTYASPTSRTRTRTVTNALGRSTVYSYTKSNTTWLLQSVAGQATTNCPAATGAFTYTDKVIATQTDEEGRITRYVRDAMGLPTTIDEADGTADERTSTYTWRTDRQLDLAVAPDLTTDYVYDGEGLLTSVTETDTTTYTSLYSTNGQTRTWAYTYTTEGCWPRSTVRWRAPGIQSAILMTPMVISGP